MTPEHEGESEMRPSVGLGLISPPPSWMHDPLIKRGAVQLFSQSERVTDADEEVCAGARLTLALKNTTGVHSVL